MCRDRRKKKKKIERREEAGKNRER